MSIAAAAAGAGVGLKQLLAQRFLAQQEAARVQQAQIENEQRQQQETRMAAGQQAEDVARTEARQRLRRLEQRDEARYADEAPQRALNRRVAEAKLQPSPKKLMTPLKVRGAAGGVWRQFEEGDPALAAGVPAFDEPRQGPAPQYEKVIRDGQVIEIRTGTFQPGDEPYEKPIGGGLGTANVQLRNARIATALNSVEGLKKLAPKRTPGPMGLVEGAVDTAQGWAGLNPQARQYTAKLQPVAMQMAVAVQGAQNLSDSERKAMAGMLGSIATMDYESQMALLDSAMDTLSNSGDVEKVGETWQPRGTRGRTAGPETQQWGRDASGQPVRLK